MSWVNPTHNVDGTLYDDPAGTRLYRSDVAGGPYAMVLEINDPVADIADVTLSEGAHYIVATAFDVLGNESANSNEALCDVVGGQTTVPQAPIILVQ